MSYNWYGNNTAGNGTVTWTYQQPSWWVGTGTTTNWQWPQTKHALVPEVIFDLLTHEAPSKCKCKICGELMVIYETKWYFKNGKIEFWMDEGSLTTIMQHMLTLHPFELDVVTRSKE